MVVIVCSIGAWPTGNYKVHLLVRNLQQHRNNNDNESYNLVTVLELAVGDKTVGSEVAGKAAGLATGACLVGLEQF